MLPFVGRILALLLQVNIAIVVDGSGSIEDQDWIEEQKFAKDAVAAFARRNIFDNGGSASYVQFSSFPLDMGTFYSEEDFDAHVDSLDQYKGGTDIVNGKRPNASAKPSSPSPILRVGCVKSLIRRTPHLFLLSAGYMQSLLCKDNT